MTMTRRYLVRKDLEKSWQTDFAREQAERLAATPEAAQYTDEEAEDFLLMAGTFDWVEPYDVARVMSTHGIKVPPELFFDSYRFGRYIFRRWADPAVRTAVFDRTLGINPSAIARLKRTRNLAIMQPSIDTFGIAATMAVLRRLGAPEIAEATKQQFTPEGAADYQTQINFGKLQMHRFLTEPEPARLPSRWEREKLARRLRLRDVQLRSMVRSRRHLRREQKTLLVHLREAGTADMPHLRPLLAELDALRKEQAQAAAAHGAALAELKAKHQQEIEQFKAQVEGAAAAFKEVLRRRTVLLGRGQR